MVQAILTVPGISRVRYDFHVQATWHDRVGIRNDLQDKTSMAVAGAIFKTFITIIYVKCDSSMLICIWGLCSDKRFIRSVNSCWKFLLYFVIKLLIVENYHQQCQLSWLVSQLGFGSRSSSVVCWFTIHAFDPSPPQKKGWILVKSWWGCTLDGSLPSLFNTCRQLYIFLIKEYFFIFVENLQQCQ